MQRRNDTVGILHDSSLIVARYYAATEQGEGNASTTTVTEPGELERAFTATTFVEKAHGNGDDKSLADALDDPSLAASDHPHLPSPQPAVSAPTSRDTNMPVIARTPPQSSTPTHTPTILPVIQNDMQAVMVPSDNPISGGSVKDDTDGGSSTTLVTMDSNAPKEEFPLPERGSVDDNWSDVAAMHSPAATRTNMVSCVILQIVAFLVIFIPSAFH